jgi:CRISPR-associated protein Csm4
MPTYRLRLELTGPFGTPFHSGTLFGHLCWAYRRRFGEEALAQWLAELPQAPWAVSDAFPADYLPRPALRPPPLPERLPAHELEQVKNRSKLAWIPLSRWRDLRRNITAAEVQGAAAAAPLAKRTRLAHNTIDRRSGHTPEVAGLWFADEYWPEAGTKLDVYVDAPADRALLGALFEEVGREGFGRDANLGRGQFVVADITEDLSWLVERPDATGTLWRMSLSHGVLTPNMQRPRYKLEGHFGKLGAAALGEGIRPWKRPLLLTRPGAVFQPADEGPFGRWIRGVHQDREEVGHNGFHFTIPFILAEEAS